MGRTFLSFRMLLEGIIGTFSIQKGIEGRGQAAFDSLMNKARQHAS